MKPDEAVNHEWIKEGMVQIRSRQMRNKAANGDRKRGKTALTCQNLSHNASIWNSKNSRFKLHYAGLISLTCPFSINSFANVCVPCLRRLAIKENVKIFIIPVFPSIQLHRVRCKTTGN